MVLRMISLGSVLQSAINGGTLVIGAPGYVFFGDTPANGKACTYIRSVSTWTAQAELIASDGAAEAQFGVSVALSGETAVIGARYR